MWSEAFVWGICMGDLKFTGQVSDGGGDEHERQHQHSYREHTQCIQHPPAVEDLPFDGQVWAVGDGLGERGIVGGEGECGSW